MVLTLTLNITVDKTYRIDGFTVDRVHRPTEYRESAGGKGINVARSHVRMGGTALATGFAGGYNGRCVLQSLTNEGIPASFIRTRNESRVCITVVDRAGGTQTEINEVGPLVTSGEVASLRRRYVRLLRDNPVSCVTLSGSLSPGLEAGIYAELISVARKHDVRAVLDASGEALRLGASARPWMVKPNRFELEQLVQRPLPGNDDLLAAALAVGASGVEWVVVTMGAEGCLAVTPEGVWQMTPPVVDFVSAVGSGDSLIGALLWGLESGLSAPDSLALGVAAGAANAASHGAAFIDSSEVRRLASQVRRRNMSETACCA